ncbi:MAG TPA: hypothetical protein GX517_13375 [Alicyclobacillus sp.]|nr:hypothetical protein [Alicyclobacillus sp.]
MQPMNPITLAQDAQEHTRAVEQSAQTSPDTQTERQQSSTVFHCKEGDHWVPINRAQYPRAQHPAMCKDCAAKRRAEKRQKAESQRAKQQESVNQIPPKGQRGGTKRCTFSLSRYTITALNVLAVGHSPSEIVEEAIIELLKRQDPRTISFIGFRFRESENP